MTLLESPPQHLLPLNAGGGDTASCPSALDVDPDHFPSYLEGPALLPTSKVSEVGGGHPLQWGVTWFTLSESILAQPFSDLLAEEGSSLATN